MDVKAYIETGILEQYALGTASDQERREVECLSKIYPEIKEALHEVEEGMETMARMSSAKPPAYLKSQIMAELANHDQENPHSETDNSEETRLTLDHQKKSNWPVVWAAAASITLLIAFWQYIEKSEVQQELAEAKEEQEELLANNEYLRGEVEYLSEDVQQTFDPSFKKIVLEPTEAIEAPSLGLIWQPETGKVKINMAGLPELPADKQYQLWVLNDGVPSDMGVLPKDFDDVYLTDQLTPQGQAFAITIEPLGGLPEPSLDQLAFIGNV
jgi:anti-sigma-K factor RskA